MYQSLTIPDALRAIQIILAAAARHADVTDVAILSLASPFRVTITFRRNDATYRFAVRTNTFRHYSLWHIGGIISEGFKYANQQSTGTFLSDLYGAGAD